MEEEKYVTANTMQYCSTRIMSPEIVEIGEESRNSITNSRDGIINDVYVAVGKDDLDVLKWALDHAVYPGTRVFLVHVFAPITYINTPADAGDVDRPIRMQNCVNQACCYLVKKKRKIGKLSKSQLSKDQVRFYNNEENNRRKNKLQKYIRMCTDAKVTVDTMLLESNVPDKAILELIPVLNITYLVMGTKRPPRSRLLRKKLAKGEFVKKNAPDYCEVIIVHDGKMITDDKQVTAPVHSSVSSSPPRTDITRNSDRKFLECVCFSGKFN